MDKKEILKLSNILLWSREVVVHSKQKDQGWHFWFHGKYSDFLTKFYFSSLPPLSVPEDTKNSNSYSETSQFGEKEEFFLALQSELSYKGNFMKRTLQISHL